MEFIVLIAQCHLLFRIHLTVCKSIPSSFVAIGAA